MWHVLQDNWSGLFKVFNARKTEGSGGALSTQGKNKETESNTMYNTCAGPESKKYK